MLRPALLTLTIGLALAAAAPASGAGLPSHETPNGAGLVVPFSMSTPPAQPETRSYAQLLELWKSAGAAYGVPWEVLGAINKIESNFGRNMGPSSAGALGWMQFMPSTWMRWGTDADGDGVANPWDPEDGIYSAARYLAAAGAHDDLYRAIFAYNHADWYVQDVLELAQVFAGGGGFDPTLTGDARLRRHGRGRRDGLPDRRAREAAHGRAQARQPRAARRRSRREARRAPRHARLRGGAARRRSERDATPSSSSSRPRSRASSSCRSGPSRGSAASERTSSRRPRPSTSSSGRSRSRPTPSSSRPARRRAASAARSTRATTSSRSAAARPSSRSEATTTTTRRPTSPRPRARPSSRSPRSVVTDAYPSPTRALRDRLHRLARGRPLVHLLPPLLHGAARRARRGPLRRDSCRPRRLDRELDRVRTSTCSETRRTPTRSRRAGSSPSRASPSAGRARRRRRPAAVARDSFAADRRAGHRVHAVAAALARGGVSRRPPFRGLNPAPDCPI